MTVRELIAHLQTLPQDFPVIYRECSDYSPLEAEQIKVQRSTDELASMTAISHHNLPGVFRAYRGAWEHIGQPPPTPTDVVIFPGN